LLTAVPLLVVFLVDHPSTYRVEGLRWGTATRTSTRSGTTSCWGSWTCAGSPCPTSSCSSAADHRDQRLGDDHRQRRRGRLGYDQRTPCAQRADARSPCELHNRAGGV